MILKAVTKTPREVLEKLVKRVSYDKYGNTMTCILYIGDDNIRITGELEMNGLTPHTRFDNHYNNSYERALESLDQYVQSQ